MRIRRTVTGTWIETAEVPDDTDLDELAAYEDFTDRERTAHEDSDATAWQTIEEWARSGGRIVREES